MLRIVKRLDRAFSLSADLFDLLVEQNLDLKIGVHPSNTIRGQVWCMIGARESYFNAIKSAEWGGFSCSLKGSDPIENIRELLDTTKNQLMKIGEGKLDDGQLIRYVYANKLKFPKRWTKRYTV